MTHDLCGNCRLPKKDHASDGACLFSPTTYRLMTDDEYTAFVFSPENNKGNGPQYWPLLFDDAP